VTKKNIIQCTTHTKDFCGKNVPKLPDLEEYFSEIIIFRQEVPAGCQNTAGF
jgi:hypothetical protein